MIKTMVAILTIISMATCNNLDRIEHEYASFSEAQKAEEFEKGWIPSSAIYPSMKDIYVQSNIDLNTCIFSYSLSPTDRELFMQKLIATEAFIEMPRGVNQPIWWIDILTNAQNFVLQEEGKTIFIAIEYNGNMVLGWRN